MPKIKEVDNRCYTLFVRHRHEPGIHDEDGCLKQHGHLDAHVFKNKDGKLIAWDYDWDCGCDDCKSESLDDMCAIYKEVKDVNETI